MMTLALVPKKIGKIKYKNLLFTTITKSQSPMSVLLQLLCTVMTGVNTQHKPVNQITKAIATCRLDDKVCWYVNGQFMAENLSTVNDTRLRTEINMPNIDDEYLSRHTWMFLSIFG